MSIELCQRVFNGLRMPAEWVMCIWCQFLKEGDISCCSCCGAFKLLEHAINVVEGVL